MSFIKNIFVGFLVLIFVFFNSGLILNVHFCKGEIESVSSVFQESETCSQQVGADGQDSSIGLCCSVQKKIHDSCCSDNVLLFQDTNHKITSYKDDYNIASLAVPVSVFLLSDIVVFQDAIKKYNDRYSFESNAPPLYRLYCRYIYFG